MLSQPSKGGRREIYIATTLRNESTLGRFVDGVRGAGLEICDVTRELQIDVKVQFLDLEMIRDRERIWVHRIVAAPAFE